MQFINNLSPASRKKLLIGGLLCLFAVILLIVFFGSSSTKKDKSTTNEYYDPASGETVSSPEGKTPETYGVSSEQVVYLGFSKLLDVGVTKFQVDATKIAFGIFSDNRREKIKEVSVFVSTIKRVPFEIGDGNPNRQITFDVIINRKDTYQATLEYSKLQSAHLILSQAGKEVFRSEDINPIGYDENHAGEGDLYIPPEDR